MGEIIQLGKQTISKIVNKQCMERDKETIIKTEIMIILHLLPFIR